MIIPRKYKSGMKFGDWSLVSCLGQGHWVAKCACGLEKSIFIPHLVQGKSTRCKACYGKSKRLPMRRTSIHRSWTHMIQRCLNPNNDRWKDYGGRGIKVCNRWLCFDNFVQDMGVRPPGHSLDRIDVDGNYEPGNCRWATPTQQQNNRRVSKCN